MVARPAPLARTPHPVTTTEVLARLSQPSYEELLGRLAGLPTRHSLSAGLRQAADPAADRLTDAGFAVSTAAITVGAGSSATVVGEMTGSGTEPAVWWS